VGESVALKDRPDLLEDHGPVYLYRGRVVTETTVGRLAREVLEKAAQPL
jgi:hypothetical protein